MKAVALLLLLASAVAYHTVGGIKTHKCGHATKFKNMEIKEMPKLSGSDARILQGYNPNYGMKGAGTNTATAQPAPTGIVGAADGWHLIRIFIDFTYADPFIKANPSLAPQYQMAMRLLE